MGGGALPAVAVSELPAGAKSWLSRLHASAPAVRVVAAPETGAAPYPDAGPETGVASYPDAGPETGVAPETGDAPETGVAPGAASARPGALSPANARMIGSGSQSVVGWRAPTSASRPLAVGRCLGSLARQRSTSGRIPGGT